ncbi:unnamed protein product [Parajaminaea phylloscopi]
MSLAQHPRPINGDAAAAAAAKAASDHTLYLLHSASLLALPRSHRHGEAPLPELAAHQARAFLASLSLAATGGPAAPTAPQIEQGGAGLRQQPILSHSARRRRYPLAALPTSTSAHGSAASSASAPSLTAFLSASLAHLPEHWRLHNPLCPSCASPLVPGINATLVSGPRRRDPARRGSTTASSQSSAGNVRAPAQLRCTLCHRGAATRRPLEQNDDERARYLASKARFPSTRKRRRTDVPPASKGKGRHVQDADVSATHAAAMLKGPDSASPAAPMKQSSDLPLSKSAAKAAKSAQKDESRRSTKPRAGEQGQIHGNPGPTAPGQMSLHGQPRTQQPPPQTSSSQSYLPDTTQQFPLQSRPAVGVGGHGTAGKAKTNDPDQRVVPSSQPPEAPPATYIAGKQSRPNTGQGARSAKQDHKAALRALLHKGEGSKGKGGQGRAGGAADAQQAGGPKGGSGSGGTGGAGAAGGGLKDFLAGL